MNSSENVLENFIALCGMIHAQAARIAETAENHFDTSPDAVTWFDVGNLEKVNSDLTEIMEFLGLTVNERTMED